MLPTLFLSLFLCFLLKVHRQALKLFLDYKFWDKVLIKESYPTLMCQPQWLESFFLKLKTLLKHKLIKS